MNKKKLHPLLFSVVFMCLSLLIAASGVWAQVVVIANKNVPADSVSADSIKDIYLGNKGSWNNGQKVVFVTLKSGEANDTFMQKYVSKSSSQFNSYWKKMVFTGKGSFPKAFDSDDEMVKYISVTDGAIGYVSPGTNTNGVKTINVN